MKRYEIKDLINKIPNYSRSTLLKKAREIGVDVSRGENISNIRKKITKVAKVLLEGRTKDIDERLKGKGTYFINSQGVKFNMNEYFSIKSLERDYNRKKDRILNNYIKKNNPSEIEIAFLKGKTVKHVNSSENIELQTSFRHENLIESISQGVDKDYFRKEIRKDIKNFKLTDVIGDRSKKLMSYLKGWNKSLELTEKQVVEISKLYKGLNLIEKTQFNKDLEHKMAMVESITTNPRSGYDTYHALKEIVFVQEDRNFVLS